MDILELALVLMGCLLFSAAIEPFIPRVSLPLVQMAVGAVLCFLIEPPAGFSIDADLLLVLFISPLLFDESRRADNFELWKNKGSILSIAIGLVVATTLSVGFALHALVPSVPLAAAFALGAALGPTDAVAVESLSKEIRLGSRQRALLTGEALFNDASGIVAFQFAVAAATTGAWSAADAAGAFAVQFLGGVAVGASLALVAFALVSWLRKVGVESTAFHVCCEVSLPFFSYFLADSFGASGILSVVSCGLLFSFLPFFAPAARRLSPASARIAIASGSVWDFVSFVLNGFVFIYLGFELPSTVEPAIEQTSLSTPWIVAVALAVTVVVMGVRFVWVLATDLIAPSPETDVKKLSFARIARNALVTTLSGPRGAVSLSIAMTLPPAVTAGGSMPVRDFLLFVTCVVIVVSLLVANFAVPLLSPRQEGGDGDKGDVEVEAEIVENVIRALRRERTDGNRHAIAAVTRSLNERKTWLQKDAAPNRHLRSLRQEILVRQEDWVESQEEQGAVAPRVAEAYEKRIDKLSRRLRHRRTSVRDSAAMSLPPLAGGTSGMRRIPEHLSEKADGKLRELEFKIGLERIAVSFLEGELSSDDEARAEAAEALLEEHRPLLSSLEARRDALIDGEEEAASEGGVPSGKLVREAIADAREGKVLDDVRAEALRLELDEIQAMQEEGRLSRASAKEMRDEIYLQQMVLSDGWGK